MVLLLINKRSFLHHAETKGEHNAVVSIIFHLPVNFNLFLKKYRASLEDFMNFAQKCGAEHGMSHQKTTTQKRRNVSHKKFFCKIAMLGY
jgi:hypothetical protein